MSRRRALTDEQCKELAAWALTRSSYAAKARELGVSEPTLRDAIARGQGKATAALRRKLSDIEIDDLATELLNGSIPRGTL
jgi:hypothetical protein